MYGIETKERLNNLRQRHLRGEALTREELREALRLMRQDRVSASVASAKSKAKKAPVDSESLLDELGGL